MPIKILSHTYHPLSFGPSIKSVITSRSQRASASGPKSPSTKKKSYKIEEKTEKTVDANFLNQPLLSSCASFGVHRELRKKAIKKSVQVENSV